MLDVMSTIVPKDLLLDVVSANESQGVLVGRSLSMYSTSIKDHLLVYAIRPIV